MYNSSKQAVPKASFSGGAFRAFGQALGLTAGIGLCATLLGGEVKGFVKREIFLQPGAGNPNGNPPTFANPNYPANPDAITYLDSWLAAQSAAPNVEDYLTKLSGFITPATTGDYVFFFASDDPGAFYLSTDETPANLKLIAQESNWSNPAQWQTSGGGSPPADKRSDTFAGTKWPTGATIHLLAGKKYYAEAYGKEGGGGDNTGVTMIPKADATTDNPANGDASTLTGDIISTVAPAAMTILKQPAGASIEEGRQVKFTVKVEPKPGDPVQDNTKVVPDLTYQWLKNNVAVPLVDADGDGIADDGSNTSTYTASPLVADNNASITVKITAPSGASVTSTAAILKVTKDIVPPTATASGGDGYAGNAFTALKVTYSEGMDPATVSDASKYKISGGVTVSAANVVSDTEVILTTSKQPAATPLTLTITGAKDVAGNAMSPNTASFQALVFKTGLVNVERWDTATGSVADADAFLADGFINTTRTFASVIGEWYYPQTSPNLENFDSVLSGFFIPPTTGDYVFFFSSDDHGQLYLSTDESPANIKIIAKETVWSNAGDWVVGGGNTGADLPSKRSDQYAETEWPTGNTIHLTAGSKYFMMSIAHEGGGGDDNTATYKLASAADPANFTRALTGAAIGTFVDPAILAPVITKRPVGLHFARGDTIKFEATVESVKPLTYQWFQNKRAVAGANAATLTISNAGPANVGDYYVSVSNANGTVTSFPDDDVRAIMKGAFVIEAEHYNYDGGKTKAEASVMPIASGNLYQGLDGLPGIDMHIEAQSTADAAGNGNNLRNGWIDGSSTTIPFPTAPEATGNVDVTGNGGDGDRGDFTIQSNYKIGWNTGSEWYNYTRDFPAGDYNIIYSGSRDARDADIFTVAVELVTGDPTKVNAATTRFGTLVGNGTGAWSSNDLIPFVATDGSGSLAKVTLGKGSTLRFINIGSPSAGDVDWDYALLYKIPGGTPPPISIAPAAGGKVRLEWSGAARLFSGPAVDGAYTEIPGAVSGFSPAAADAARYFKLKLP